MAVKQDTAVKVTRTVANKEKRKAKHAKWLKKRHSIHAENREGTNPITGKRYAIIEISGDKLVIVGQTYQLLPCAVKARKKAEYGKGIRVLNINSPRVMARYAKKGLTLA